MEKIIPGSVSVVIVSYNLKSYIENLVSSFREIVKDFELFKVIIVDNASTDGSKEWLQNIHEEWFQVLLLPKNIGFGRANNVALKNVKNTEFVLLLNPDTEIGEGVIDGLVQFMNENKEVGVVGPRVVYPDNSLQVSAYDSFPGVISAWLENTLLDRLFYKIFPYKVYPGKLFSRKMHDRTREVAHVLGAAMFTRKQLFDDIGYFDERFFLFREETDWQRRVINNGWKICYFPDVKIVHHEGRIIGDAYKKEDCLRKFDWYLPSVYMFEYKWGNWFTLALTIMAYFFGSLWTLFVLGILYLCLLIFGWMLKNREKYFLSVRTIFIYHWSIVYWHLMRIFSFKSLMRY